MSSSRGFPHSSVGKESACNVGYTGDMGSILGSERPPWRRKWLPTPVCLPGKSHEHRSLLDYSLWGCKELNMSEQLTHRQATANVYSVLLNVHTAHLIPKKKKESTCNAGDPGSIPGSGRSTGEEIVYSLQYSWASLLAQLVKNLPAMQETWVWSLGWEDPLEKGKATHSSILAWRIPWTIPWDLIESDTTERLSLSLFTLSTFRLWGSSSSLEQQSSNYRMHQIKQSFMKIWKNPPCRPQPFNLAFQKIKMQNKMWESVSEKKNFQNGG